MTLKVDMANNVMGLNPRGFRWYLLILIPEDLRGVYEKDRVNPALGTSDRREAIDRAHKMRAKWGAEFESKRRELKPARRSSASGTARA